MSITRSSPVQVAAYSTTYSQAPKLVSTSWSKVSVGPSHVLAIKSNNTLWAWGINTNGQVGDGTTISRSSPVQLGNPSYTWNDISAGINYSVGLRGDGLLFTWGLNTAGVLGDLNAGTTARSSPIQVGTSSWNSVSAGGTHIVAIRSDKSLWGWGLNTSGQLGSNDYFTRSSPVQISTSSWVSVSAGQTHTTAITSNGKLFTWGDNTVGTLGYTTPAQNYYSWTSVAGNADYTVAIRNDGLLFAWGTNNFGQLGDFTTINRSSPVQIGTSSWSVVSANAPTGGGPVLAIRSDGTLWGWGYNVTGVLGLGDTAYRSSPVQVSGGGSWIAVASGPSHAVALKSDYKLYTWGLGTSGQLGDGIISRSSPVNVGSSSWTKVSAGYATSYAIGLDGALFAWGANTNGQQGDPSLALATIRSSPTQIGTNSWTNVFSYGSSFVHAIDSNNKLFGWGANGGAQLGYGDANPRSSPVQISSGNWSTLGGYGSITNTLGIQTDGSLWGWGSKTNLLLGEFSNTSFTYSWSQVSAGPSHTAAIRSDGRLYTWGLNSTGQIGNGTTVNTSSPTLISVALGGAGEYWNRVSVNGLRTIAISNSGRLWAWGSNAGYLLGDGTSTNRSAPTQIGIKTGSAFSFNGSNQYLTAPSNAAVAFGTGNITIEFWAYLNASTRQDWIDINDNTNRLLIYYTGSALTYYAVGVARITGTAMTLNSWQHVAFSRVSGSSRLFINGVQSGGTFADTLNFPAQPLTIGKDSAGTTYVNGYMSGIRILKGVGLYTTTFSIPTSPPSLIAGSTSLLLTTSTTDDSGTLTITNNNSVGLTTTVTPFFDTTSFTQVNTGLSHSLAITSLGKLYTWGDNTYQQLGQGSTVTTFSSFVQVGTSSWSQVSSYGNHSLAIDTNNKLYAWGDNTLGQIGVSNYTLLQWRTVNSYYTTQIIRNDGIVYAMGLNNGGQLGDGTTISRSSPVQLSGGGSWSQIVSGYDGTNFGYSIGIKTDGTLYTWGLNNSGILGDSTLATTATRSSPVQIGTNSWLSVSTMNNSAIAIRSDYTMWAWGKNANGQLGDGTTVNKSSPIQVGTSSWTQVSVGASSVVAIELDGTLYAWGLNANGQIGDGTTLSKSSPVQIGIGNSYIQASTKNLSTFGIRSDYSLWAWGDNSNGKLGTNDVVWRSSPTQVNSGYYFDLVSAGFDHALAKRRDGTIVTWGLNDVGQLGMIDGIGRSSPTQIGTSSWVSISAGYRAGFGITTSGGVDGLQQLYAWGLNDFGSLGINNSGVSGRRSSPTQVATGQFIQSISSPTQIGTNSWTSISAGLSNSMAIRSDYKLFTWGDNSQLQSGYITPATALGTASNTNNNAQSYVRSTDNALIIWGSNDSGQIGDNTIINRSSPVQLGLGLGNYQFKKIARAKVATLGYTLGIKTDGTLWSWGNNAGGKLGNGDTLNRSSPTQVSSLTNWSDVAAGPSHALAIKSDGSLWGWGLNTSGQAGVLSWSKVSSGSSHTLALRSDGQLFGWGSNTVGQVGDSSTVNRSSPVQLGAGSFIQIATGINTSAAIRGDNTLWTWGLNSSGALGQGDTANRSSPTQLGTVFTALSWTQISARDYMAGLTSDYRLFTWGSNTGYQLGNGTTVPRSSPVQVGTSSYTSVSAGGSFMSAIRIDGGLFIWGTNTNGQLGLGDTLLRSQPTQIGSSSWSIVSASNNAHTLAVTTDGKLYAWGINNYSQLGLGDTTYRSSPVQVGSSSWTNIYAGTNYSVSLRTDNTVWAWGEGTKGNLGIVNPLSWINISNGIGIHNDYTLWNWGDNAAGQLGISSTQHRSSPVQIGTTSWISTSKGISNTFAIKSDGSLWAWGLNSTGQLGLNDTVNRSSPVQIGSSSWTRINSGSAGHTLAITTDGLLFGWGLNNAGQLGDGTTVNKSSPIQVGTSSWTQVSAGFSFSTAIRTDGGLFTWGFGTQGQLGSGLTTARSSPVQVGTSSWTQVSAGDSHTMALRYLDGGLFTWGFGTQGQLGSSATVARSSPVQVGTTSWSQISAGISTGAAITTLGGLFTWGLGSSGQLGSAATANRSAPVQVGASSWISVSAGKDMMFAYDKNNRLFAWGANALGQLGLNDVALRSSPVQVGTNIQTLYSNPTQISSSMFPNTYSTYFNGTNDYLMLTSDAAFAFGSNNFTIECWIYSNNISALQEIFDMRTPDTANIGFDLFLSTSTIRFGTNATTYITGTTTLLSNTWYHVAISRSGATTYQLFLNGVQEGSTYTTSQTFTNNTPRIGNGVNGFFNGYISNLRVITGQGLYTGTFTPSSTALTNNTVGSTGAGAAASITGTVVLLTCQSTMFVDNSGNNYPIQIAGMPILVGASYTQISAGESNTTLISTTGVLFNAGDAATGQIGDSTTVSKSFPQVVANATLYDNRSSPSQIGTGSWSQIATGLNYSIALKSDGTLYTWGDNTNGYLGDGTTLTRRSMSQLGTNSYVSISSGGSHTVALRSDLTLYAWGLNNAGQLGDNSFTNRSSPVQVNTGLVTSWNFISAGASHTMGIDATTNLPYGWGLNTSGQLGDNSLASKSAPVAVSSPSASNYSYQFNGTTQYLEIANNAAFVFGTGDFTIEAWVNLTSTTASRLICSRLADGGANGTWSFNLSHNSASFVEVITGEPGPTATFSSSILNTWSHVAVSRQSGVTRIFLNGIKLTEASQTTNFNNSSYVVTIGRSPTDNYLGGYVSNLRVIKGTALYTSGFYPSAGALTKTSQGATASQVSLLTAQSATIIDNSTNAFTITNTGTVTASATYPFGPYYSASFNGTTQYLSIPNSTMLQFTGAFTIESFVYFTTLPTTQQCWFARGSTGLNTGSWNLGTVGGGSSKTIFQYNGSGVGITFDTSLIANTWYHIALVRDASNVVSCYINGIKETTTDVVTQSFDLSSVTYIGTGRGGAPFFGGYLSNVRFVKDVAVYTNNFIAPTNILRTTQSAMTNIVALTGTETSLLTLQNATIIDNSTNGFTITNNNIASVTTAYAPFSASASGIITTWDSIQAGVTSTMGTSNNTLYTWGAGTGGQLGDGTTVTKSAPSSTGVGSIWSVSEKLFSSPIQVGTAKSWSIVTTGGPHTIATATDNTVWSWGQNTIGQLGDNTTVGKSSPTQIASNTSSYTFITAGVSNTFAIRSTSALLFVWGQNNAGQLGDASTVAGRSSPVQVFAGTMTSPLIPIRLNTVSGSSYTLVQAGSAASAIDSSGRLFTWGTTTGGQLGDNTSISRSSPVQVGGIQLTYINSPVQVGTSSYSQVSAGASHTLVIDTNSLLYAWGKTPANGQSVNTSSPIQIGTNSWLNISTGSDLSLATNITQTLYAWGLNTNYQLGSPNFYLNQTVTSPVAIGTLALRQGETSSGGSGNGAFIKNI